MKSEMAILPLVRPAILALKPYASARSLGSAGILLDANESPWPLRRGMAYRTINRYPHPQPPSLVRTAAKIYRVRQESVLVSRGSDEGIDLLVRALCESPLDRALLCPPTYGLYETVAGIQGCGAVSIPLRLPGFQLDAERIIDAVRCSRRNPIKLVFICSPNNPTGTVFPHQTLEKLCRSLLGRAVVVVDEAYQEFAQTQSMTEMLVRLPNLVVLKTLSKAWSLAGVRCGFTLAHPTLISILQRIRAPYPMSCATVQITETLFNRAGEKKMRRSVERILAERNRLCAKLSQAAGVITIFPSQANFLLVKVKEVDRLLRQARASGLQLRDRSNEKGLEGCVRISVGTRQENNKVIACFLKAGG